MEKKVEATDKKLYYIFSSFSHIDKVCHYIAEGIAGIHAPQIELLTKKGAEDLADSAGKTLKYYISKHKGKLFTPDNLAFALGQYCINTDTSRTVHKRCKKIECNNNEVPLYDVDIFLGSGIKVGDTYYERKESNEEAYFYIKDGISGRVYTKAPTNTGTYGYRNATADCLEQLQKDYKSLSPASPQNANREQVAPKLEVASNNIVKDEEEEKDSES